MNTLTFLCVILFSACATGLDLDASKSHSIFHLIHHHFNNQNESKQIPLPGQFPHSSLITILWWHGLTIWSSYADVNSHNKVVVCYVEGWSAHYSGNGEFLVENIDPMLCTHIIYAFAGLDNVTHSIQSRYSKLDTEEDGGKGIINKSILNMNNWFQC